MEYKRYTIWKYVRVCLMFTFIHRGNKNFSLSFLHFFFSFRFLYFSLHFVFFIFLEKELIRFRFLLVLTANIIQRVGQKREEKKLQTDDPHILNLSLHSTFEFLFHMMNHLFVVNQYLFRLYYNGAPRWTKTAKVFKSYKLIIFCFPQRSRMFLFSIMNINRTKIQHQ